MRVLIGCETSGKVRDAFRELGHEAYSLDLLPGNSPYHIQAELLTFLEQDCGWDLAIFRPDCTYLCSSGLHWNKRRPERAQKTEEALEFVRKLMNCGIPKWAIENPRGCIGTRIRKYDQTIQPYEFGDNASKQTDLWLHNLPPLLKDLSRRVPGRIVTLPSGREVERWSNQTDSGQNRLGPSADRWQKRAETYDGIARAMALQWGKR